MAKTARAAEARDVPPPKVVNVLPKQVVHAEPKDVPRRVKVVESALHTPNRVLLVRK